MKKLMMFSSKSCGPCKIAKPSVESFVKNNSILFEYNCYEDCSDDLFDEYEISSVPTFILNNSEKSGETVKRVVGWNSNTINEIAKFFE